MSLSATDEVFGAKPAPATGTFTAAQPPPSRRAPSRRVRHEDKITVYLTPDELLDLEHARLTLRSKHAIAVDRGRIVRAAITAVLEDLEATGAASELVRRLQDT